MSDDDKIAKLHRMLVEIDGMVNDPDVGKYVWSILSSFTPAGLRHKLNELEDDLGKQLVAFEEVSMSK